VRPLQEWFAILIFAGSSIAMSSCREKADPLDPAPGDPVVAQVPLEDSNPLLGKPVTGFVTEDPNGNKIDLNQHIGKQVILLDFWATWCVPCMMAMPEVEEIANRFKDRGLVFYAVNVGEDPDTVKEFLAQRKLDIPVAMDFDGQIQNMYQAFDLPHTIVIGKDGRLQVDHRGYWKGFGAELSGQVEALLDGENLVGSPASE
jgi:thiol-disulfide isomerase/thioredoxin